MSQCFDGRLFTFHKDPYSRIPVFLSGNAPRCVVWVGAQGDGFFSLGYMHQLVQELRSEWTIAQWIPSSSFIGYGGQCHNRDAEDLDDLIGILLSEHNMKEIVLFATSTGVQIALEMLARGKYVDYITRVVLQGIVADPAGDLYAATTTRTRAEAAEKLVLDNRREDIEAMKKFYDIPITPARYESGGFPSLQEALWLPALNGNTATLKTVLERIRVPLLVMISLHSNFYVSKEQQAKFETAVKSQSVTKEVFISYFNDTSDERRRMLKTSEAQHTAAIVFFLREQDEKRRQLEEAIAQAAAEQDRRNKSVLAQSSFTHRIQ